jgi:hypothetical protein
VVILSFVPEIATGLPDYFMGKPTRR